jgi:hypothetical protein
MLLWADGFDHYGTDESNLTDGVYASYGSAILSTTQFATGTHSLKIDDADSLSSLTNPRKVLPSSTDKLGAMARFYLDTLPSADTATAIFDFMTNSALRAHVTVTIDSNGALRFYRGYYYGLNGANGTLIATTDPILTAAAWNHIEVQVYLHDTAGWIRVAVNGVHRYEATTLDTKYDSSECWSVANHIGYYTSVGGTYATPFYMDDYIIYDFEGDSAEETDFCPNTDGDGIATNYIGELQCMYLPVNGDTAEDDWVPSSGSDAYAMVDETTPNDADYISSTASGDLSEFALTDLPEDITYVRGLQLIGRLSKSDSGAAMIQFGMKSVAATDDADERPVTVEPTYWWDFINVDPNTSARWTRASLNAAWLRLTRSV